MPQTYQNPGGSQYPFLSFCIFFVDSARRLAIFDIATMKKDIILGADAGGKAIEIDLPTLLKTRLLIQANSGGGKSWLLRTAGILIERNGERMKLTDEFFS